MRSLWVYCCVALPLLGLACTRPLKVSAPVQMNASVDGELSLLEKNEEGCIWKRLRFPGFKERAIAQFPAPCLGADVAWSKNLQHAVVSFNPRFFSMDSKRGEGEAENIVLRAFEVELATGKVVELPSTQHLLGELMFFGWSNQGIVALSLEVSGALETTMLEAMERGEKTLKLSWGEETFLVELPERELEGIEGMPSLAHAWLLHQGAWKRIESKWTTTGWDYAMGEKALEIYAELGPIAHELLHVLGYPREKGLRDAAFAPWMPENVDDERVGWEKLPTLYGNLYSWTVAGEFAYTSGLLLYQPKEKTLFPLSGLGFGLENIVAIFAHKAWLLVAEKNTGAWPRLYNLKNGELIWASDSARAVVFWPDQKPLVFRPSEQ
ncbi:MAG: hypothetical protein FWG75_03700 [Cystobacterineae bacterium]|nr:hypothetical protein [Cystobacterineae bacterium]